MRAWLRQQTLGLLIAALILAATAVMSRQSNLMPQNTYIPFPPTPSPNARDYFTRADKSLRDKNALSWALSDRPVNISPADPQQVADWNSGYHTFTLADRERLVRENAFALARLREGLKHSYLSPGIRSIDVLVPYPDDRKLAQLLTLNGDVHRAQGQFFEAADCYLDVMRFGNALPHGGAVIGGLVAVSMHALARKHLSAMIDQMPAAEADAVARTLMHLDASLPTAAEGLTDEKWLMQSEILQIFSEPHWRKGFLLNSSEDQLKADLVIGLRFDSPRRIYDGYTRYIDLVTQRMKLPWPQQKSLNASSPIPQPTDPVNSILLPLFDSFPFRLVTNQALNRLLAVQFALRAYFLDHGGYPKTLDTLAPKYIPNIPSDPFADGERFKYRLKGTKYILYSVGPDGVDNDGQPIFQRDPKGMPTFRIDQSSDTGDIVAGVNS